MAAAATMSANNTSVITGTRIAINVNYDQREDSPDSRINGSSYTVSDRSSSGHGHHSSTSSSGSRSSPLSTPTIHTKSTGSAGDLITRLDEQLKDSVQPQPQPQPESKSNRVAQYTNGPDQVIPSEKLTAADRFDAVKLKIGASGPSAAQPISIHTMMKRAADKYGALPALRWKKGGDWQTMTFSQYEEQARQAARAFIKLGLEPKGSVCILGFNSAEWFLSSLGAILAGGVSAGVYTTNNVESCYHCAADSSCNIFVVEDDKQLQKVLQFRDRVPSLRAIVQYSGTPNRDDVLSWQQLMEIGGKEPDVTLAERTRQVAVNQVAALIYTSGTTGPPKGVMLSHDNITFMAQNCSRYFGFAEASEHLVSYLPLSHVAAMLADIFLPLAVGGTVWFADKNALKGSLGQTLAEVRPTAFIGVPRVFEKIKESFETKTREAKGLKRSLLLWAMQRGKQNQLNRINGSNRKPMGYGIAKKLVLAKIHRLIGMDRIHLLYSGAAPLAKDTLSFFHCLDLPLLQLYGMSESTGPHTATTASRDQAGSVGPTVDGFYTRLDRPDPEGQGEICMGGRHVFMGYLNLPDKTEETVDTDGWLHSGDLGIVDQRGLITITGRSKELVITAGGENIPPVLIEEEVMKELPIISNCCLIGDKRKYLTMLITLKVDVNTDTLEPTDNLSAAALDFCRSVGSPSRTVHDIIRTPDEKVMVAIQAGIDRANSRAISAAQRVQKWTILPVDFSIPGGEIGPTMKMKRPVIHKKYADVVERLYA